MVMEKTGCYLYPFVTAPLKTGGVKTLSVPGYGPAFFKLVREFTLNRCKLTRTAFRGRETIPKELYSPHSILSPDRTAAKGHEIAGRQRVQQGERRVTCRTGQTG